MTSTLLNGQEVYVLIGPHTIIPYPKHAQIWWHEIPSTLCKWLMSINQASDGSYVGFKLLCRILPTPTMYSLTLTCRCAYYMMAVTISYISSKRSLSS